MQARMDPDPASVNVGTTLDRQVQYIRAALQAYAHLLSLCNVVSEEMYRLLTPDQALKAPKLEGSIDYPTWRTTFVNFAYGYGVHTMLIHGPQHMTLPTQHTQLTAEERMLAMAGYTPKANGVESIAAAEYKLLQFAYLALQHAVSGNSMAKSVVSAVPSPNATEAWRKLETALHSTTTVQREIAQRKLQDLQQQQSEDIAAYAARAGELSTKLASLGAPQSEEQVMTAFTRGMRSLAAWQRDALKQRCHSLEEMVALARSYEEEDACRDAGLVLRMLLRLLRPLCLQLVEMARTKILYVISAKKQVISRRSARSVWLSWQHSNHHLLVLVLLSLVPSPNLCAGGV